MRAPVDTLAIGEIDQTVFDCPKCARPLAMGARRCPGCRTRLVMGIPVAKATAFVAVGLAVGLAVGSVGAFVVAATRTSAVAPAASTSLPSAAPVGAVGSVPAATASAGTATPPSPSTVGPSGDMPALTRSALSQAITVDERLENAGRALRATASASPFDASDVAQVLREISADAVYGQQLADRVSAWPDSASVGGDLAALYTAIHDRAADALVASVRNQSAYRENARAMLGVLATVPTVDDQLRELATTYGVAIATASANP